MGQGSDNAAIAPAPGPGPGEVAAESLPALRRLHPARSVAFHVLRFASVLIGAGLLLRTASAVYVASAPESHVEQPDSQFGPARPAAPQRLALPTPAFGHETTGTQSAAAIGLAAPARQTHHSSHHAKVAAQSETALAVASASPAERALDAAPSRAVIATRLQEPAAAQTVSASVTAAPALAAAPPRPMPSKAQVSSSRAPSTAAAGLLTPVKIVSGASVLRSAPAVPSAVPAPVRPQAQVPAPQPVQISLAAPVMRPGPHTTALVSDVRTEMRRPASAWDYAEGLPPELTGRAAQRQAMAEPVAQPPVVQPVTAPKAQAQAVSVPSTVSKPRSAMAAQLVAGPAAGPVAVSAAPAAAPRKMAPMRTATASTGGSAADAPARPAEAKPALLRPVALLARAPVPAPLAPHAVRRDLVAADVRKAAQLEDARPVRARAAPPPERASAKRIDLLPRPAFAAPGADETMANSEVVQPAGSTAPIDPLYTSPTASTESALADATSSDGPGKSLRDRMPRPAF